MADYLVDTRAKNEGWTIAIVSENSFTSDETNAPFIRPSADR